MAGAVSRVMQAIIELGGRVVHRAVWELYHLRVRLRRWVLDRALSRHRRARLLEASMVFDSGSGVIYTVAAPVGIEPQFGYLVRGRSAVLEDALMGSQCVRMRSERYAFSGVPTLRQLSAPRVGEVLPSPLISLRHVFGSNYYHAVVDCLGALALLDEHAEFADVPIVVDANLRATTVMQAVVDSGLVDPARLIVQGDRWLESEAGISFVVQDQLSERSLRRTNAYVSRAVSTPDAEPSNSRLYVRRGVHSSGRALRNEQALVAELEGRGFECIDPGDLSWEEQYHRFRAATHVIGVHGAALTNMLFRAPDRLALLELTPPDHHADVFQRMAQGLGYRFHRVEGTDRSPGGTRPSFVIDIDRVLAIVDDWDRGNESIAVGSAMQRPGDESTSPPPRVGW